MKKVFFNKFTILTFAGLFAVLLHFQNCAPYHYSSSIDDLFLGKSDADEPQSAQTDTPIINPDSSTNPSQGNSSAGQSDSTNQSSTDSSNHTPTQNHNEGMAQNPGSTPPSNSEIPPTNPNVNNPPTANNPPNNTTHNGNPPESSGNKNHKQCPASGVWKLVSIRHGSHATNVPDFFDFQITIENKVVTSHSPIVELPQTVQKDCPGYKGMSFLTNSRKFNSAECEFAAWYSNSVDFVYRKNLKSDLSADKNRLVLKLSDQRAFFFIRVTNN